MNSGLKDILDYILDKRGVDCSGYHTDLLERRIGLRLTEAGCHDYNDYLSYVMINPDEMDALLDVVTINVSRFYRDTLTFELLAERVLPAIVHEKARKKNDPLRIWSAGCAMGEEPYSVAIMIHELLRREGLSLDFHIFATDSDARALEKAAKAVYSVSSIENLAFHLLSRYFRPEGDSFRLIHDIKNSVTFSHYDILDKKNQVPPESIFGDFDLVLCRNLLIYFNNEYQEFLFAKLYNALVPHGCLVLGAVEEPTRTYKRHFRRMFDFSSIYLKI